MMRVQPPLHKNAALCSGANGAREFLVATRPVGTPRVMSCSVAPLPDITSPKINRTIVTCMIAVCLISPCTSTHPFLEQQTDTRDFPDFLDFLRLPRPTLWYQDRIKEDERNKAKWESYLKSAEKTKSELLEALSSDLPDHHRRQLQEELESVKVEITNSISEIQCFERYIQNNERRLAEHQRADVERQRKENSEHLFDKAMKDGHVRLNIINMLLSGVAGSGKTSLKHLLTDQPPPQQRNSTGCMEKPLRVRSVTSSKFKTTGRGWEEISEDKTMALLAQTIAKFPEKMAAHSVGAKITETLKEMTLHKQPTPTHPHSRPEHPPLETHSQHVVNEAIQDMVKMLVHQVSEKLKVLGENDTSSSDDDSSSSDDDSSSSDDDNSSCVTLEEGELFDSTWVYISDCGGQPQFHDVSPLFIRYISLAAIVFRLIDDFSSFPLDEYYKDGQLVGLPRASHMTLEETLRSLIRSLESHCSPETKPKLMFVGTFLDQLERMGAVSLGEKDKAVLSLLSADMKERAVFPGESFEHPIFAINTISRDAGTLGLADKLREAIERCRAVDIKVPIWWFVLDLLLQNLANKLKRGVLTNLESFQLALRFGFEQDDLEAALKFFNKMCIAHYYHTILPEIVFVNAQIPLDKISELTEYAIALRNVNSGSPHSSASRVTEGKWKRFRDEGLITLEFLQLKQFNKHYVEGIFSPKNMLAIMKELLVIAPIPLSENKFFMPSLLESVSPSMLSEHRVSSDSISPILICFPSGCIRSGVFCCLVVHLMKEAKWQVLLPSGEPVLLAKNCVKFRYPSHPCTITLIDSFSYLEVFVKSPPSVGKKLCSTIRDQTWKGIKAACNALHYNNDIPQLAIFCPCALSVKNQHQAGISEDESYWICSSQVDVWGDLPDKCKVWLGNRVECRGNISSGLEYLKQTSRVSDRLLNSDIKEIDFNPLGRYFDSLSGFLERLHLTRSEHADVKAIMSRDDNQAAVAQALRLWRTMNPSRATFRNLLEIVLDLRRMDIAEDICKYIVETYMRT